jgi:Ras-related C3 botulinum toxin substrate 1
VLTLYYLVVTKEKGREKTFSLLPQAAMEEVPKDVLRLIFSYVGVKDLLSLAQVSKRFNDFASEDVLWRPIYWTNEEEILGQHFTLMNTMRYVIGYSYDYKVAVDENKSFKERCFRKIWAKQTGTEENPYFYKVTVVGDAGVGKTTLLSNAFEGTFGIRAYMPTDCDTQHGDFCHEGIHSKLFAWDPGGGEDYSRLRALSYPGTEVFVLCFSIIDRLTFKNVSNVWVPEIQHHCPRVKMVLVATKIDLRDDETAKQLKIPPITEEEGLKLAKANGFHAYIETSAVTGKGLEEALQVIHEVCFGVDLIPGGRGNKSGGKCALQ